MGSTKVTEYVNTGLSAATAIAQLYMMMKSQQPVAQQPVVQQPYDFSTVTFSQQPDQITLLNQQVATLQGTISNQNIRISQLEYTIKSTNNALKGTQDELSQVKSERDMFAGVVIQQESLLKQLQGGQVTQ